jgi:2'-5' RNA ligase
MPARDPAYAHAVENMAQGEAGACSLSAGKPAAGEKGTTIRCFVALQPDAAARDWLDQLAHAQHSLFPHARRMHRDNLHLTVAFIGALDGAIARHVAQQLATQTVETFDWTLGDVGVFERARVLWVGSTDRRLDALAVRVRRLLDALDVHYDRKPFVAHVTLLRKLPRSASRSAARRIEPPILWRVAAPVLLQSKTDRDGTRYTPVAAAAGGA